MKIVKILSHNAVIVVDDEMEKVAIGKGVGFNKTKQDTLEKQEVERLFVLQENERSKLQFLLNQIEPEYILLAEKIISYAEKSLMEKLNEHLLIALTDHIAFTAENIKNGIFLKNKLLNEIKILYKEEFSIAIWAIEFLNQNLAISYSYADAGLIAIHIHSSRYDELNKAKNMKELTIISNIIHLMEADLNINIHSAEVDLNYIRLVHHLQLVLQRYENRSTVFLDPEIIQTIEKKYPESYALGEKIKIYLLKNYHISLLAEEVAFITLHIERLKSSYQNEKGEK